VLEEQALVWGRTNSSQHRGCYIAWLSCAKLDSLQTAAAQQHQQPAAQYIHLRRREHMHFAYAFAEAE